MLYSAETLSLVEGMQEVLARCDRRMLRYMVEVKWQDRVSTEEEVARRCGVAKIEDKIRQH